MLIKLYNFPFHAHLYCIYSPLFYGYVHNHCMYVCASVALWSYCGSSNQLSIFGNIALSTKCHLFGEIRCNFNVYIANKTGYGYGYTRHYMCISSTNLHRHRDVIDENLTLSWFDEFHRPFTIHNEGLNWCGMATYIYAQNGFIGYDCCTVQCNNLKSGMSVCVCVNCIDCWNIVITGNCMLAHKHTQARAHAHAHDDFIITSYCGMVRTYANHIKMCV